MPSAKGYAALAVKEPLVPFDFERRHTGDHDVALDIKFCGICHSDIHQARDEWGNAIFPMVPGHEMTGVVTAVGPRVTKFQIGDHVGVGCFVDSCGTCKECRRGLEQHCAAGAVFSYNSLDKNGEPTYGGYSDKVVVNENYLLRIPPHLPLDAAAPLLCAGITLYSPLRHWGAGPGKRVAIIGLGGLGHMGVKLGRAMGAEVSVFSQSMKKEADAQRLGAHHYYATNQPDVFSKLSRSFDLIINTVSAPVDWNQYTGTLDIDGALVMVGLPGQPVAVNGRPLIGGRRSIAGSMIGGIPETQEMLDFCGQHNIVSDIELIAIQHVNEAYERVLQSDVRYRFVINLASLHP